MELTIVLNSLPKEESAELYPFVTTRQRKFSQSKPYPFSSPALPVHEKSTPDAAVPCGVDSSYMGLLKFDATRIGREKSPPLLTRSTIMLDGELG